MRTPSPILRLLMVTAATALSAAGCRHSVVDQVPANAAVAVKVINNNFSDVNVFADGPASGRRRLGMVTGQMSATFKLPSSYAALGEIQLFGVPIGGFGAAQSGTVQVAPGEIIVFTLQADLTMSSVTIQQP